MISNSLYQVVLRPDGTLEGSGAALGMRVNITGTWSATGNIFCITNFISGVREGGGCGPAELRGSQLIVNTNSSEPTVHSFRR